ncbi:MAG: inositol monophosphatase family protein [Ruegeria sp.]
MLSSPYAVAASSNTADIAAHASEITDIVARAARGYFRGFLGVEFKADESPVTQSDKGIEAVLRQYLADNFPDDGVFGEEQGAVMNGKPITVSETHQLSEAILYVNEGHKIYRDHPALFKQLMKSGQTRRFAYDCYSHALLTMGHVDAVIDYDLQPYDYLPVTAVVEAAGGIMSDWDGKPLNLNSDGRVISAATPQLHSELLELVNG